MPPGYTFHINRGNYMMHNRPYTSYTLRIMNNKQRPDEKRKRTAAKLTFVMNHTNNSLNVNAGETYIYGKGGRTVINGANSYKRKGFGAFLRAMATRAGMIAQKSKGYHTGAFTNADKRMPPSTRILPPGWNIGPEESHGLYRKSTFNFTKSEKQHALNAHIQMIVNRWIKASPHGRSSQ